MPTPTIIDCDPGCDDVLALLLALTSEQLEVIAYVPQFGNTDVTAARGNILKTYGVLKKHLKEHPVDAKRFPYFGKTKPVIIRGANGPVCGKGHTAKYFHGADGLGGINEDYPDIPTPSEEELSDVLSIDTSGKSGHEAVLDLLERQEDASVTYIALGPLTNLALAIRTNADLFRRKVAVVSIMGGALDVPGNTTPVAEFNVYADATAAFEVFEATPPLPIYLAPLDITTGHALKWDAYRKRVERAFSPDNRPSDGLSPLNRFTGAFLRHVARVMHRYGKEAMELHDPLSVYFAMCHPPNRDGKITLQKGWEVKRRDFVVERQGDVTTGMCVVDRRKGNTGEKGKSKADLQAQADQAGNDEAAPVQVDDPKESELEHLTGVNVIVKTPGSDDLVDAMLSRIWGA